MEKESSSELPKNQEKIDDNSESIEESEFFEEGFRNFESWIKNELEGKKGFRGNLIMGNWGSGDASTTLYYGYDNGGGATSLNKFHPEGYDWYFQSRKVKGLSGYFMGLNNKLRKVLEENNITITVEG